MAAPISHFCESEYQIVDYMVSKFINILNKGKKEIKAIHLSYSVIVAAVCHVTSMETLRGNFLK